MNQLFDRKLLKQNRARASRDYAKHSFLYHEIANGIIENLQSLERDFDSCLEIGARDGYLLREICRVKNVKYAVMTDFVTMDSVGAWSSRPLTCDILNAEGAKTPPLQIIADDESLPFEKESFDLIVSNLNLHHINLMPQFLLQIRNLLKPGGMFIASFFGEENLPQLHKTIFETENEIYNGVSPRMIPTIDVKTAANLLQKAGFINPLSELERVDIEYEDPLNLLKDLKMMGQGNIMNKRSRRFFTRGFLQKVLENYRRDFKIDETYVRATFEVVTMVGWKN